MQTKASKLEQLADQHKPHPGQPSPAPPAPAATTGVSGGYDLAQFFSYPYGYPDTPLTMV